MSFNVSPKAAPASVPGALHGNPQAPQSAKERAIAAFKAASPAQPLQEEPKAHQEAVIAAQDGPIPPSESETPEAQPEVPAKAEETQLSSQYAQLARKEKAIRAQAMQVKAQNDALAAREAAIKAKEAELGGDSYIPKAKLTADTMRVLQEAGISYEQITQMALNAPSPEESAQQSMIAKLEAKIAALEEGQTKVTKTFEESQQNAYKQAVNQIKNEAKQLVYSSEEFETIKTANAVDEVADLITRTFDEGMGEEYPKGTLLTVEEAAQMVEDHLFEEAFKYTKLKKIQKRLAEQAVATAAPTTSGKPAEDPKNPGAKQVTMKTLTNKDGSARKLTSSERAILAFKGELKR